MIEEVKGFEELRELARRKKDCHKQVAIVYVRVSTQEQADEGYSLDAQRKYLLSYAEQTGRKYAFIIHETESARRSGRSQFRKLVDFYDKKVQVGNCPILIVEKTDRLVRNSLDKARIEQLIKEKSLEVHYAKESKILSKDSKSSDFFLNDIQAATASFYVNLLAEEAKKGMTEKAAQGMFPSVAPIGYLNAESNGRKIIIPDPERAPLITKIFQWYDSGHHSLRDVTRIAKEHGLTSRSGNPVPKSSISEILNRLTYTGSFLWNNTEYPGTYDPIISRELYDRVQIRLHGKEEPQRRPRKHSPTFKGLFRCGQCGCAIVADPPKKGRYIYYHCTGNKGECPNKRHSVREEIIEGQVLESLRNLRIDDEILEWMISSLREHHATDTRIHEEAIRRLERQKSKLEQRRKNLVRLRLDEEIEPEDYDAYKEEIRRELVEIENRIEMHREASPENLEDGIKTLELMQVAETLYKKQSREEKRKLIRILHSNSILNAGKLQLKYRKPFDLLVVTNAEYQQKKAASGGGSDLRPIWLPGPDSNQRQGG